MIVYLDVTKNVNNHKRTLHIQDSYSILNDNLKNLALNFQVDTWKGVFPYKFSKNTNLFYLGRTPNKSYYNNIKDELYRSLVSDKWSFKDESLKYLNDDINSLYEVLIKANKQIFLDYNIDMTDSLTISGLSVRVFLKNFYSKNIPLVNKASIYRDIKKAYYGGITEVYKPFGHNIYYYDVNSLYPYVALQDLPGLECSKNY